MDVSSFQFETVWRQFRLALSSFVWIPIPKPENVEAEDINRSLLWHPLVGFAVGICLAVLQFLLIPTDSTIAAAVVLVGWVVLTGGLHLEHVPEAVREWLILTRPGTDVDTESSMRTIPSLSIAAIIVLKFAALIAVFSSGEWAAIIVACVAARASVAALLLTLDYTEPRNYGGLNEIDIDRTQMNIAFAVAGLICVLIGGVWVFVAIMACVIIVFAFQRLISQRSDGISGNSCNALVEVIEAIALCVVAV